jgi:hypothetical protein
MTQFTFNRAAGTFWHDNVELSTIAYSGHGPGVNNPAFEAEHNIGPLPAGTYSIGPAKDPIDILGPVALPLTPIGGQEMFGRSAFFIHGDNASMNHTASDGCIILPKTIREYIAASPDKTLVVV